ncbi:MAG TPA: nucleoside hydrolase [Lentisphaeria bacterium]|nr:MAG: hypothetical protein A2X45_04015 [Lentisphaerae bacterium GWF2_50_93]HCE46212.1 nucleoside hydrolase [Lentisphaeria bacterium]
MHREMLLNNKVKLILDTDMLTDCDDAAAMAILHKLADGGEVEILATMVSSRHPMSGPVVDVINTYYGRPQIPIGAPKNGRGAYRDDSSFLEQVAAEFPHSLDSNDSAPDAVELYRKILADAEDCSITVLTIGYMSNLADLLKTGPDSISGLDGSGLVGKKVRRWVCMGGNFPEDPAKDNVNFTRDPASALYAIRNWPGEIIFTGREIGHRIFIGDKLKNTPLSNPVRRSYQLHRERFKLGHWNHHTADPCAVLYAVRDLGDYWDVETGGYIDIQNDCSFKWIPSPKGRMGYLIQKMDRKELGAIMEDLLIQPPKQ